MSTPLVFQQKGYRKLNRCLIWFDRMVVMFDQYMTAFDRWVIGVDIIQFCIVNCDSLDGYFRDPGSVFQALGSFLVHGFTSFVSLYNSRVS